MLSEDGLSQLLKGGGCLRLCDIQVIASPPNSVGGCFQPRGRAAPPLRLIPRSSSHKPLRRRRAAKETVRAQLSQHRLVLYPHNSAEFLGRHPGSVLLVDQLPQPAAGRPSSGGGRRLPLLDGRARVQFDQLCGHIRRQPARRRRFSHAHSSVRTTRSPNRRPRAAASNRQRGLINACLPGVPLPPGLPWPRSCLTPPGLSSNREE